MGLKSKKSGKNGKVTQGDLAEHCGLDQGTVSRILNSDSRGQYSAATVERVIRAAREMGYLHPRLLSSERRRYPRREASITARVQLNLADGSLYDEGTCEISDVSVTGMRLSGFETARQTLPLESFRVWLNFDLAGLRAVNLGCAVTRVNSDEEHGFSIGVRYEHFTHDPVELVAAVKKEQAVASV